MIQITESPHKKGQIALVSLSTSWFRVISIERQTARVGLYSDLIGSPAAIQLPPTLSTLVKSC